MLLSVTDDKIVPVDATKAYSEAPRCYVEASGPIDAPAGLPSGKNAGIRVK
jgi:hypothetical protein